MLIASALKRALRPLFLSATLLGFAVPASAAGTFVFFYPVSEACSGSVCEFSTPLDQVSGFDVTGATLEWAPVAVSGVVTGGPFLSMEVAYFHVVADPPAIPTSGSYATVADLDTLPGGLLALVLTGEADFIDFDAFEGPGTVGLTKVILSMDAGDFDGTMEGLLTLTLYVEDQKVPEPAALALMGLGLAGLGFSRRRKVLR